MESDRVAVLSDGKLEEIDTPQHLLSEPQYSLFKGLAKDAGIVVTQTQPEKGHKMHTMDLIFYKMQCQCK